MEHFYNIDSFEQFLRDNTRDFKMMPKRRVWFSIYNNLHPSKRYPSFYTALFLLISLASLDFYNINNTNYKSINCKNQFVLANPLNDSKPIKPSTKYLSPKPLLAQRQNFVLNYRKRNFKTKSVYIKNKFSETKMEENSMISNENKTNSILSTKSPINLSSLKVSISNENFLLRENQNFSNLFSYEIYASPSLVFNTISNDYNELKENLYNKNNRFRQKSNLNLYAGGSISYHLNNSIRIKAGLEFRYSKSSFSDGFDNTDNTSFRNNISTKDNFTTNNLMQDSKMDFNTYNISFPIGTDFELAGNNNIHWYAGASIEPTLNLNDNNGYIYQNEPNNIDLKIRNWNLNSNIETYLSLKINKKTFFNAGPQFRYQWFSTYENMLNSNSKNYNLGMKFGVSKTF